MSYDHAEFFPEEAFNPELLDPTESEKSVFPAIQDEIRRAAFDVRAEYSGTWDIQHELDLADAIQDGIAAERKMYEDGHKSNKKLETLVEAGKAARYNLVVANLPFAVMMAKASVGIRRIPNTDTDGVPGVPRKNDDYMGRLKEVGTYSRIANLATPDADLEERMQIAMEAMWNAATKYVRLTDRKNGKFITFSAWHIQTSIKRSIALEQTGWSMSAGTFERYTKMLEEAQLYGIEPVRAGHSVVGHGTHTGLHPVIAFAGREAVSLVEVTKPCEEEVDLLDEPVALPIEDITEDPEAEKSLYLYAEFNSLMKTLDEVLDTLSEREAGVVSLRFGLFDGQPKTLDEIGKVYGLTRERIRQIESKSMSKLRHASRADMLRDFDLDLSSSNIFGVPVTVDGYADGATGLKLERILAHPVEPFPENNELRIENNPDLESWQADADDTWDEPVRPGIVA